MTEHILKTLSPYWHAVNDGVKNFEVRRDDRGFQKGDVLILRRVEYRAIPSGGSRVVECRSGDNLPYDLRCKITYVLTGGQLGIEPGYVVMGIKKT